MLTYIVRVQHDPDSCGSGTSFYGPFPTYGLAEVGQARIARDLKKWGATGVETYVEAMLPAPLRIHDVTTDATR